MTPIAADYENAVVTVRFRELAAQWKDATAVLSSTTAMVSHPAYQAIIRLGWPVVPLMLQELEQEPVHWFEALRSISGEDPVPRDQW